MDIKRVCMVREELNLVSYFYLPYFYYYQIITLASFKLPLGTTFILRHHLINTAKWYKY